MALRTKTITGANQYSDGVRLIGYFNLSLSGTWVATVTIQRSFDDGSTWFDVKEFTVNTQEYGFEPERMTDVQYRIGVKTGNFTSGEVVTRLSQ